MPPEIAIASDTAMTGPLQQLAERLSLPLVEAGEWPGDLLLLTDEGLTLVPADDKRAGRIRIDFASGRMAHRRLYGGGRGQPLAKAVGLKKGRNPEVLDATAGLGRDGFVLATLGCRVRMVERSPIIWALLEDALERARREPQLAEILSRISLQQADSQACLEALSNDERPQVIYLDPMYPHRKKSALVKKEMRIFRQLVGDDPDAGSLLRVARERALNRVVVKRPAKAPYLDDITPSFSIESPNTRYDVHVIRAFD